jgi:hypothetical protein
MTHRTTASDKTIQAVALWMGISTVTPMMNRKVTSHATVQAVAMTTLTTTLTAAVLKCLIEFLLNNP